MSIEIIKDKGKDKWPYSPSLILFSHSVVHLQIAYGHNSPNQMQTATYAVEDAEWT